MVESEGALVIDAGSSSCKAGWSGEDMPRSHTPSVVSSLKSKDAREAKEIRGAENIEAGTESMQVGGRDVQLTHPVVRGKIEDFDNVSAQ